MLQPTIRLDFNKIGRRVQEARNERHLTQEDLCDQCGCTIDHLSRFENGKGGVSLELLFNFSVALDKSLDYFVMDNPHAKPETVIDNSLAEKLSNCDPQTLVVVGEVADRLLAYKKEIEQNVTRKQE